MVDEWRQQNIGNTRFTDPNSSKLLSFVRRDIEIDECYTKMNVGGRVVVPVASEGESITFQWLDA